MKIFASNCSVRLCLWDFGRSTHAQYRTSADRFWHRHFCIEDLVGSVLLALRDGLVVVGVVAL